MDDNLMPTAIHEAAHEVICRYFMMPITSVEIDKANPNKGRCEYGEIEGISEAIKQKGVLNNPSWPVSRYAEKKILCSLAGVVADYIYNPHRDIEEYYWATQDIQESRLLMNHYGLDFPNRHQHYTSLCLYIISLPSVWGSLLSLADKLCSKEKILGEEAECIIDGGISQTPPIENMRQILHNLMLITKKVLYLSDGES